MPNFTARNLILINLPIKGKRRVRSGDVGLKASRQWPLRFVRCQSIRQRPRAVGTQTKRFTGVPLAW